MTKSELNKYLGKRVTLILIGGEEITGTLYKCGDERFEYSENRNLYTAKGYFTLIKPQSCLFRESHVSKIKIYDEN